MSSFPQGMGSGWDVAEQPRTSGFEGTEGKAAMAFAGEVPWHGLGQDLSAGADLATWQKEAGLDWSVIPSTVHFDNPLTKQKEPYKGKVVLVRSDTGKPLSVVTHRYRPVQPGEVIGFFKDFVEGLGAFKMETAGSLRDGVKIWALAKAEDDFVLDKDDVIRRHLLLATSYDLSIKTIVQQTSVRVVCANTLTAAYGAGEQGKEVRITVSHRTAFNGDKVKEKMMLDEQWQAFGQAVRRLADKRIDEGKARELIGEVFFPKQVRERVEFSEKGAKKRIDEIIGYMGTAPGQKLGTADGTVWGALNAVTYFVDHVAKSRNDDVRLDKAWFGDGAVLKNRAFDRAMALVEA
jgi:phage/plasmid-like protein (TIGR03299 family)